MTDILKLDRRDFLKLGAITGGGLVLGVYVAARRLPAGASVSLQPNAFVQVATDGRVRIWVAKAEMGQGVRTTLPMIVADELDADWSTVEIVQADAHPSKYGSQMTVGSRSVRSGAGMALRSAGAAAREMLVAAAAAQWGVAVAECRTEKGLVKHDASGRSVSYGGVAERAAALSVPERPRLKDPSQFTLIGKPVPQVDTADKVTGRAGFGIDVRVPNMLYATVVHCPVFGGSVKGFDGTRARTVPGVKHVVQVSQGVAVVAEQTWAAFQGAKALKITWDSGSFSMGSRDISNRLVELADGTAAVARQDGDCESALRQAAKRVTATYELPYLAHATMEPMNCTADVRGDRCEVWAPTQSPQGTQSAAARITGLPVERVTVHVTYLGCGWGRRSRTDFVQDAVETSMKVGAPVQVLWTREEDMQHDLYRPTAYYKAEGGVDSNGRISALKLRVVATPIRGRGGRGGVDRSGVDGAANTPYGIPNILVDNVQLHLPVPTGHWRSVGPSRNAFVVESFIDELAHSAGRDPLEVRLELLSHHPRLRHVLEVAAKHAGWGTPPPTGRARGIGLVENKGGLAAQIAEVSLEGDRVRVHRVTCAFDAGRIINPKIAEAQIVGSVVTGLGAALYGEITLEGGRVAQSNFHDYPMLRISEMPEVSVHIVESTEEPGGVGEPAVPPTAPAVTNALFALTGKRIRKLPITLTDLGAAEGG